MLISHQDDHKYEQIQLNNGAHLLLVSSKAIKRCAGSVSIKCGYTNDPPDCPGLAHLLEHVLLAGKHKDSSETNLLTRLQQHGGFVNAWTAAETMNVHFECPSEELRATIQILVSALSQPVFKEKTIAQEIDTIDAEFSLRLKDEHRRLQDVQKSVMNPAHPFSQFAVGNKQSYSYFSVAELKTKLARMHQDCFSAHSIKIVLACPSNVQLDLLRTNLVQDIERLPRAKQKPYTKPYPALFLDEQLERLVEVRAMQQSHNMIISHWLESSMMFAPSQSFLMFSHLLSNEHPQGLLWWLRHYELASEIHVNTGAKCKDRQQILINIVMSKSAQPEALLDYYRQYLTWLSTAPIEDWRFNEKRQQIQIQKQQQQCQMNINQAVLLATRLQDMSLNEALTLDHHFEPCASTFTHFLKTLSKQKHQVFLIRPSLELTNDSVWLESANYHTAYTVMPLPRFEQACLGFCLPPANPFMPKLDISKQARTPLPWQLIKQSHSALGRFIISRDAKTLRNMGDIYLSFHSPHASSSVRQVMHKRLWCAMMEAVLSDTYGSAELAGLYCRIYSHQTGFGIHVNGFTQQQFSLLGAILNSLRQLHVRDSISTSIFEQAKQKLIKNLNNALLNKPLNQALDSINIVLKAHSHDRQSMYDALENISASEQHRFGQQLMHNLSVEGLLVGDHCEHATADFMQSLPCIAPLDSKANSISKAPVFIRQASHLVLSGNFDEAATALYFQADDDALSTVALYMVLDNVLSAHMFHYLRHVAKLGYAVGSGYLPVNKTPAVVFYAQSPRASSTNIEKAIRAGLSAFVEDKVDVLANFDAMLESLVKQIHHNHEQQAHKAHYLWQLFDSDWPFDEAKKLTEEIKRISFARVFNEINKWLQSGHPSQLVISCPSNTETESQQNDGLLHFSCVKSLKSYLSS